MINYFFWCLFDIITILTDTCQPDCIINLFGTHEHRHILTHVMISCFYYRLNSCSSSLSQTDSPTFNHIFMVFTSSHISLFTRWIFFILLSCVKFCKNIGNESRTFCKQCMIHNYVTWYFDGYSVIFLFWILLLWNKWLTFIHVLVVATIVGKMWKGCA